MFAENTALSREEQWLHLVVSVGSAPYRIEGSFLQSQLFSAPWLGNVKSGFALSKDQADDCI